MMSLRLEALRLSDSLLREAHMKSRYVPNSRMAAITDIATAPADEWRVAGAPGVSIP
jgi:hypothetical protein